MPELQSAVSDGMRKQLIKFKITFTILFLSVVCLSCVQEKKPQLIIADKFHNVVLSQFIDPTTEKFQLTKLREEFVANDDLEVRVWVEVMGFDGFILKRKGKIWTALAIKQIDCSKLSYYPKDKAYRLGKIELTEPKSGWENIWQKLFEAGILNLPDSSELPNRKSILDGIGYFVETNKNGIYRTYCYGNPQMQEWKEAEQMLKIGEIVADEFDLVNFKEGSKCLEK